MQNIYLPFKTNDLIELVKVLETGTEQSNIQYKQKHDNTIHADRF